MTFKGDFVRVEIDGEQYTADVIDVDGNDIKICVKTANGTIKKTIKEKDIKCKAQFQKFAKGE
jgi:hypothetical protein